MIRQLLPRKKQIGKQSLTELMHQMIISIRQHKVRFIRQCFYSQFSQFFLILF